MAPHQDPRFDKMPVGQCLGICNVILCLWVIPTVACNSKLPVSFGKALKAASEGGRLSVKGLGRTNPKYLCCSWGSSCSCSSSSSSFSSSSCCACFPPSPALLLLLLLLLRSTAPTFVEVAPGCPDGRFSVDLPVFALLSESLVFSLCKKGSTCFYFIKHAFCFLFLVVINIETQRAHRSHAKKRRARNCVFPPCSLSCLKRRAHVRTH